jgi:hypothetical protein
MSKYAITVVIEEFLETFLPKLDQLDNSKEKVVCARLLKAALENYIERNDK